MPQTLPDDVVLLHIGPRKTGTTAIQSAFADGRDGAESFGVLYPGRRRSQFRALGQLIGRREAHRGGRLARRLTRRVQAWPGRALVSGEVLEYTRPDQIKPLVAQLGGDRVQVLITARPLNRMLPSLWQQHVKSGASMPPLDTWVTELLSDDAADEWFGQRIDRLAERWGSILGAERINVLLIDPTEPDQLVPTVEQLLGIPSGTLTVQRSNRGMTSIETELVRGLHQMVTDAGSTPKSRKALKRAIDRMLAVREPGSGEGAPRLTERVEPQVQALQAHILSNLAQGGFRIIGDPASWESQTDPAPTGQQRVAEAGANERIDGPDAAIVATPTDGAALANLLRDMLDDYTKELQRPRATDASGPADRRRDARSAGTAAGPARRLLSRLRSTGDGEGKGR